MKQTLRNYIYLDEEAIQGLYNQIYDNIIDEKVSTQNNFTGDIEGEAEVSGLIKALVNIGGNIDAQYAMQKINEKQILISIEKKTNILISEIADDKCIKIKDILNAKHPLRDSVLFVGKALFTLTALYDKNGLKTDLDGYLSTYYNQNPSLVLESGSTYHVGKYSGNIEDDQYYNLKEFEDMKYGVIMHIGGEKIRQSIRHLTHHIEFGKKFLFSVFGEIYYNTGDFYTIKPFAIWR